MSGPDPIGASTMSPAMHQMDAYPRYLLSRIEPALGNRVWEIGVGHGQYTTELRRQGRSVLGTDIDEACVRSVADRFADDAQVTTGLVDLRDEASVKSHRDFRADSIVCLNVLEHIEDDVAALQWLRGASQKQAGLGLIVPAHPSLFGKMDEEAGHYRRYTRSALLRTLQASGWSIEKLRYINSVGAAGWWYHNRLRRDAGLADPSVNSQMVRIDRWLPRFAKFTDPLLGGIVGLSVLAIARNTDSEPSQQES